MSRSFVCVLAVPLAAALASAASDQRRITKVANVRLRHAPTTDASISAELPLGSEVVALNRTTSPDPWYRVKIDGGLEGWVLGRLTTSLVPERRDRIVESIVLNRLPTELQLNGGILRIGQSFSTRLQLFDVIERTAASLNDRQIQARFALYRLRAMDNVLAAVPFRGDKSDPYRGWIETHQDAVTYNEPGGLWMVAGQYVMQTHETYRDTAVADDIAWFFVRNGLPGECEGDVPCYVDWQNRLNGEYLRLYPGGRHAGQSNGDVARALNGVMDNLLAFPRVLQEFNPATRCVALHASLDPLAAAVTASTSSRKAGALAAINRFAQLCR